MEFIIATIIAIGLVYWLSMGNSHFDRKIQQDKSTFDKEEQRDKSNFDKLLHTVNEEAKKYAKQKYPHFPVGDILFAKHDFYITSEVNGLTIQEKYYKNTQYLITRREKIDGHKEFYRVPAERFLMEAVEMDMYSYQLKNLGTGTSIWVKHEFLSRTFEQV